MSNSDGELREALQVIMDYYRVLARHVADEILEHKEDFQGGEFGQAESIIDKYARQVEQLGAVYSLLRFEAWTGAKPKGREPLAVDEFRCFGCGEVIRPGDTSCPLCGWSWR